MRKMVKKGAIADRIPLLAVVKIDGVEGVVRGRTTATAKCPARYDVMVGTEIRADVEGYRLTLVRPPSPEELARIVCTERALEAA